MSGRPLTWRCRMGKSARMRATSREVLAEAAWATFEIIPIQSELAQRKAEAPILARNSRIVALSCMRRVGHQVVPCPLHCTMGASTTTAIPGSTRLRDVLVIEDDTSIRETIAALLEHAGFTAQTAPDGLAALEIIEQRRP